jgi:hypothetical protein
MPLLVVVEEFITQTLPIMEFITACVPEWPWAWAPLRWERLWDAPGRIAGIILTHRVVRLAFLARKMSGHALCVAAPLLRFSPECNASLLGAFLSRTCGRGGAPGEW